MTPQERMPRVFSFDDAIEFDNHVECCTSRGPLYCSPYGPDSTLSCCTSSPAAHLSSCRYLSNSLVLPLCLGISITEELSGSNTVLCLTGKIEASCRGNVNAFYLPCDKGQELLQDIMVCVTSPSSIFSVHIPHHR